MISDTFGVLNYEEICDVCRNYVTDMDLKRWFIGDSALTIETHYGERTLADFSKDIGQNQSTVKGWKRVSKFYPESIRRNLLESNPNLTYTYYRDALRLENLGLAMAWLEEVSANGYTADEAAHKLTEKLGHATRESAEGIIYGYTVIDGKHLIEIGISEEDMKWLVHIDKVTIRAK